MMVSIKLSYHLYKTYVVVLYRQRQKICKFSLMNNTVKLLKNYLAENDLIKQQQWENQHYLFVNNQNNKLTK